MSQVSKPATSAGSIRGGGPDRGSPGEMGDREPMAPPASDRESSVGFGGDHGSDSNKGPDIDDLFRSVRAHAQMTDTRDWIETLERMVRVAWNLMTPDQRKRFCEDPEITAIAEAGGEV